MLQTRSRMTRLAPLVSLFALLVVACGGPEGDDDPVVDPDAGLGPDAAAPDAAVDIDAGVPVSPDGCAPMFGQTILPQYELTIAPAEWAALEDEFHHRAEREAAGLDPKPYHPAGFTYVAGNQRVVVDDVQVRLKGNSSWAQTIAFDADPKMQFVISFNEVDPAARFLGVRKVDLDMPRTDYTFIRQRLGLRYLRAAGVPAQCANNARLVINGAYYGLYTNLEHYDKEFRQRVFGHDDDDGDLWEGGRIISSNETTFTWDRLDALWAVTSIAELDDLADLDASMYAWAAEMVVGDVDGYGNGFANFYVYDHPTRGFVWLPVDLDTVLDRDFVPPDQSPVFAPSPWRWELDWYHYLLVMNQPAGMERFVTALAAARGKLDVAGLQADLDGFAAQIAASAAADPRRPFTLDAHHHALDLSRAYIADRAAAIDAWLACRTSGGADRDGDGLDLCHDCDDQAFEVHAGATEVCNMVDDDCDGLLDDGSELVCP